MSTKEQTNEEGYRLSYPVPSGPDDATLVARAREGDLSAFERLVRRYEDRLFRLAWRMSGNKADAEDVVQEVFLTAWRRLPELRDDTAISSWLYRTTTTRTLNALRKRHPTDQLDQDSMVDATLATDPQSGAVTAAQVDALNQALFELPANQRAVWLLREVHGRSYDEIAKAMSTTAQAVRGRLARARAQLAELMQPWQ